ncbi:DUF488 domain-containing protein [Bdellovibrio sp. 22V]|uniref:DUF488 domain-containing protein n=1 Tax=Bdellovibrio TaxID=958 RepID=UPI0025433448|nr:DUF488 domain-containing protein [Bdellovibrio sp. 22V]WII71480.1 DUF488 domain-containing protein [Bdellovibrio sp. 22V]
MTLFTIGYEASTLEEFIDGLKKNKIKVVVDVRKNPVSRKKGFSKRKLAEALEKNKIGYGHFPGLGVPSAWRKEAKEHKITREHMFKNYQRQILPKQDDDLESIAEMLRTPKNRVALLCFEANADDCHRRYVAEELHKRTKAKVKNITLASQDELLEKSK